MRAPRRYVGGGSSAQPHRTVRLCCCGVHRHYVGSSVWTVGVCDGNDAVDSSVHHRLPCTEMTGSLLIVARQKPMTFSRPSQLLHSWTCRIGCKLCCLSSGHIIMYGRARRKAHPRMQSRNTQHIIVGMHRVAITHDKMTLTISSRTTTDDKNG